ncbi:Mth938-like domain-containing protein [Thioalkalivibrio sp. XN279]|uniref:Mth938-like domain-containing protein n=1 Tax=Thioalkalivibrio sp. XN279 TaxID=2714953 RepID=UPI00140AC41B|nr:MTH938/NDUFAF3 family protein [Thioalkalivibrio sp. XN279]NHA15272.1 hypothetical protein [Thioalkalivibrio sp. XN279]
MRLTLDSRPGANLVTRIGPAGIQVGEDVLDASFIISPGELLRRWAVSDAATLDLAALAPALALEPEILVLGTGARIQFPARALFAELAAKGIGLEVMDTAAACRTYNVLAGEERAVVAAIILP